MSLQKRTVLFSGRVQGVGFRATVVHFAQDLSLAGSVQNLSDGSVELIVEGTSKEIDTLIERLREHFATLIRTVSQDTSPAAGFPGQGIRILR